MKKGLIIGCASIIALGLLVIVIVVVWFAHVSADPKGVAIKVEGATEAKKGEPFDLVIHVTNERPSKPFKLTDIDIHDEYIKHFIVISTEPEAKSSMHVPVDNSRSFSFDVNIPAKQEQTFTFKLKPTETGTFSGDVDVCEGSQFLTTMAQTEVK